LTELEREAAEIYDDLSTRALEVISGGWYLGGKHVDSFCESFARYCCVAQCVGCGNGTDALEISMRACGITRGDEVLMVANAGMYAAVAARAIDATPVYVDIDPDTHLVDHELLDAAISERTRAIVATHLYGSIADMDEIVGFARKHDLRIIEDCAQAHGAVHGGQKAGSFGDAAAFSFYPTKNLGALGDAGAVLTNSEDVARRARGFAQYGWVDERYHSELEGSRNSRIDSLQAAFLEVKLKRLDELNARREAVFMQYVDVLAQTDVLRLVHAGRPSVHHLAIVETQEREALQRYLAGHGIQTAIHYPVPDHFQHSLQGHIRLPMPLTHTEKAAQSILTIPCHPTMTEQEVDRVSRALAEWVAQ
jgi:dTDP-4-amino-4,6-dideoxygalactose transaminase